MKNMALEMLKPQDESLKDRRSFQRLWLINERGFHGSCWKGMCGQIKEVRPMSPLSVSSSIEGYDSYFDISVRVFCRKPTHVYPIWFEVEVLSTMQSIGGGRIVV